MSVKTRSVDSLTTKNCAEREFKTPEQLRTSEVRYRRLFEAARDGILILDAVALKICDVNPFMIELLDYTRADFLGKELWELGFFEDKATSQKAFRNLQSEGYLRYQDLPLKTKQGEPRAVEFVSNVYQEDNRPVIQCNIRDITARKIEAEKLKESTSQFGTLFSNAPVAVLIANDEGVFIDANPAAAALFGVSLNEIRGRTIRDFLIEDSTGQTLPMREQSLIERRLSEPIQVHRPDGSIREVDFFATTNFLPGRHFSLLRDVSDQRKIEEQLRQSRKLESIGILAGGLAHDFNNLLKVILGYCQLSSRSLEIGAPLKRNLEEIRKAAERASSLTQQLLAFSRKQVLQPKVLDLNALIVNIVKMLARLVGEDVELKILQGTHLGNIKADPGQLEQVILNLVVNARDAMPTGGEIILETSNVYLDEEYARRHDSVQSGSYVMLSVTDTGHGMDAETQKLIFEPFYTTKQHGKGTGLGLATVYGIVKQSGGSIEVSSQVGLGTSFKIYLPLTYEALSKPAQEERCADGLEGNEVILLTEDDETLRNLAKEVLELHGYTVLDAANGADAMIISKRYAGKIHLLLTDVRMPGISGCELAEQVVRSRPETRVLYMSGYTDGPIIGHCILEPEISLIEKPFTPDSLVFKVTEVLRPEDPSSHSPDFTPRTMSS